MDIERLDSRLKEIQTDPSSLMKIGMNVGHYLPDHQIAQAQVAGSASQYLNSLRPVSSKQSPLDQDDLPVNSIQTGKFRKALEIAENPLSVLDKVKEGTLTSEDVKHLQALYPKVHDRIVQKINNRMTEHVSDGNEISQKVQRSLSLLTGQNLNSSITPEAIQSSQSTFIPSSMAPSQQPPPRAHKTPLTALKKVSSLDATPLQKIAMAKN